VAPPLDRDPLRGGCPTPRRTSAFFPEARAQVTAVACSLPQMQAVPLARWSRAALAQWIAESSLVPERMSASTIGRWLAAEKIRPWRYNDPATCCDRIAGRPCSCFTILQVPVGWVLLPKAEITSGARLFLKLRRAFTTTVSGSCAVSQCPSTTSPASLTN
jgi:hypothetical protein